MVAGRLHRAEQHCNPFAILWRAKERRIVSRQIPTCSVVHSRIFGLVKRTKSAAAL